MGLRLLYLGSKIKYMYIEVGISTNLEGGPVKKNAETDFLFSIRRYVHTIVKLG